MIIKENKIKDHLLRVLLYSMGCFGIAFGVVFMLRSNVGLSTWDTLHYALHALLDITLGESTVVVAAIFTVVIIFLNKNLKYLFMAIPIVLVGELIDVINLQLLKDFNVSVWYFQIPTFLLGLFTLPLGGSLLIVSRYPAGVFDEFTLAIMRITKSENLIKTRGIIEVTAVITALIIGLIAGIGLGQLSFGTIISSLSVGPILTFYLSFFERIRLYEIKQND